MFVDHSISAGGVSTLSANSPVANQLQGVRWDPGYLRPYFDKHGNRCVTVFNGMRESAGGLVADYKGELISNLQARGINSPVFNATTLRKEEWLILDREVLRAARLRLRAWSDLAAANSYGGFNGMSKLILEHETMADVGEAIVDMNGITPGRNDGPKFQLQGLPLPITHSDFSFDARRLAVSRNTGTPLDSTMGEMAARRVAEKVEKVTIGVETGITYGGNSTQVGGYGRNSTVYGYTNFPSRLTKTNFYKPNGNGRSGTGWTPSDTIKDVLAARDALYLNKFYGPWVIYTSNDWDQYLDNDYIVTQGSGNVSGLSTKTLRERLRGIEGIVDVRRLDFLSSATFTQPDPADIQSTFPFRMVFVQMTPDVARAVVGMDFTTVQWENKGGMELCFKVMCILVPQLRADFLGNCGILDATATL